MHLPLVRAVVKREVVFSRYSIEYVNYFSTILLHETCIPVLCVCVGVCVCMYIALKRDLLR